MKRPNLDLTVEDVLDEIVKRADCLLRMSDERVEATRHAQTRDEQDRLLADSRRFRAGQQELVELREWLEREYYGEFEPRVCPECNQPVKDGQYRAYRLAMAGGPAQVLHQGCSR